MYKLVLLLTLLMGTLATQAQMQNALSPKRRNKDGSYYLMGKMCRVGIRTVAKA